MDIPFAKVHLTGKELQYINQLTSFAGGGHFTHLCEEWLQRHIKIHKALLTHSCTAALEMAALLIDTKDGDEIIMPSYTFVSTANAFIMRGGVPVFVDIRPDNLNIDETKIESAITSRTKAIVPVHYAGVACEMDTIKSIAKKYGLFVLEDAAHGLMAYYKNRPLGSIGELAAFSFHETKNVVAGEGGSLIINDKKFVEMAEIIREKGTNRCQFFRGEVDKYSWQHIGSSYLPNELTAAFLLAQLEEAESITTHRMKLWNYYHILFADLEKEGLITRPIIPAECQHNAHIYYILLRDLSIRPRLLNFLKECGIQAVFHYTPLHTTLAGKRYGKWSDKLHNTEVLSQCIIRLPLFFALNENMIEQIVTAVTTGLHET